MMCRRTFKLIALVFVAACTADVDGTSKVDPNQTPNDVADALAAMPEARVLEWTSDGLPKYIVGEMVKVGAMQSADALASDTSLRPMLVPILKAFRMTTDSLSLRKMT